MATDALEILAATLPVVAYLYAGEARTLVYVSPQIEQLTGCTLAGLVSENFPLSDLWHPDDQDRVELAIAAALADRREFCVAYRIQHDDGSWRWVEDRGRGVYDERGLAYLAGTLADISERVAGEGRRRCRVLEGADRDQGQSLILAHADSIDLAILDVNLPHGKGTELFSQLRARRPRVPVLFSSGFEQPDVSRGDDPTVSFLAKPYRSQALVEHVTTLLDLGSG